MKNKINTIVTFTATLLIVGVLASMPHYFYEMTAKAAEPTFSRLSSYDELPQPLPLGIIDLLFHTMEVNTIARLAGESPDIISQELAITPIPSLLHGRNISPQAFHNAMDEQSHKLIELSLKSDMITKSQADDILRTLKSQKKQTDDFEIFKDIHDWACDGDEDDDQYF
jgi:hypothetical protein